MFHTPSSLQKLPKNKTICILQKLQSITFSTSPFSRSPTLASCLSFSPLKRRGAKLNVTFLLSISMSSDEKSQKYFVKFKKKDYCYKCGNLAIVCFYYMMNLLGYVVVLVSTLFIRVFGTFF